MSSYVGPTMCGHSGCYMMVCNEPMIASTASAFSHNAREEAPNSNRAARRRAVHAVKVARRRSAKALA